MFALGLWTLASALGCCIGFTVIQRSGGYYDYRKNPKDYQWQPLDYQGKPLEYQWEPTDYQGQPYDYQSYEYNPIEYQLYDYQPYDYQPYGYQPYDYQPYDYHPYDYQPYEYQPHNYNPYEYQSNHMTVNPESSYSGYYNHYYPTTKPSVSYGYDTKPKLPYGEAQKLLQVFRLIRVIVVFRPPTHTPATSLDLLVHELTDHALHQKLVDLLYLVPGYRQVAELANDPAVKVKNSFVNDYRRLLLAIQRALNPLDLTIPLDDHLREKLRELRHRANALTVEQIEAELHQSLMAHAKEAVVSDVLENLQGEVETTDLKQIHENYDLLAKGKDIDEPLDVDKIEKNQVMIVEPEDKKQHQPGAQDETIIDALDNLAGALEIHLENEKKAETNRLEEKTAVEHEQILEPVTTVSSTTAVHTTTHASPIPTPAEETKDSWLGSLIGKGNLLAGHYGNSNEVPESEKLAHPIDVSQPAVLVEPAVLETGKLDNSNVWVFEEIVDNDLQDFDIDQRFQSLTPAVENAEKTQAVTHSVPLWLIENSKNQKVENKQLEDIVEKQNIDEEALQRQLPGDKVELAGVIEGRGGDDDLLLEYNQTKAENISKGLAQGEVREIPVVEEEGPARFDLPVDLFDRQETNPTPYQWLDVSTVASATPTPMVKQLTTVKIHEVHTESAPVESSDGPTPQVTQTAPSQFVLPVDSLDHSQLSSTPETVSIDQQLDLQGMDMTTEASATSVPTVDQLTTVKIHEVNTESVPAESREGPIPQVTQTAPSQFDLPVDSLDHQQLSSTPKTVSIDQHQNPQGMDMTTEVSATSVPTVGQLSTVEIHEVNTESAPVESREEPIPQSTQTGDLLDHQQQTSTTETVLIDDQQELQAMDITTEASATSAPTVDQFTTDNIHEVPTESVPVESREESILVTEMGPARLDLPVDSIDHQQLAVTVEPFPIDGQQEFHGIDMSAVGPTQTVDKLTTLNAYEVHTESIPVESWDAPIPPVSQTATSEPDARRFVREEIMKVLNLLEESNGFSELKERITEQDLNELVDELSHGQEAIRWTDMISALQRLISNKRLDNGNRITEILELWNATAEGHLDDGYFTRTYGKEEPVENRQIQGEIGKVDVEQVQLTDLQETSMEESDAVTKRVLPVDEKDNYFDETYKLNNESVNQSLPLNGSEIHNASHTQLQNKTAIVAKNFTTEIHAESRDPRILHVDDNHNETEYSTESATVTDESSVPQGLQAEEVSDKLEVTTPESFPVNETESVALD